MPFLIAATRKGFFRFDKSGQSWEVTRTAFLGDSVSYVVQDPRTLNLYAALNLGHFGCKLQRSTDGGKSWEEIGTPTYPKFPEGREPDRCPMRQIEIPWKLELIWALVPGGDDQPGRLWCGTIPGGLFKSDDHGQSWSIVESLWNHPARTKWFGGGYDFPGIHSICVDPRDSKTVTIGVSCGGVWRTKNDGASWKLVGQGLRNAYLPPDQAYLPDQQDPHLLAMCSGEPDHFYVQHHNGIFYSRDGAENFSEITEAGPSTFGFAVAVDPNDPETAWFAPGVKDEARYPVDGELVITRTRDSGKNFDVLRNGLPQSHSYDLIYRHGLIVDDSGQVLAAGSTTGNLWVSENQGDSWYCVSQYLPPIYGLYFGQ